MKKSIKELINLYPEIVKMTTDDINEAIDQSKDEKEASFYLALEGYLTSLGQKKVIEKGEY